MNGTDPPPTQRPPAPRSPWQALVLTRTAEFRFVLDRIVCARPPERAAIEAHLRAAEEAAREPRWRLRRPWRRNAPRETAVERAFGELDAAEASLLRLAPDDYFIGQLPSVLAQVRSHLPRGDERLERLMAVETAYRAPRPPRRTRLGRRRRAPEPVVAREDRTAVISAFRASSLEARRELARVHSLSVLLFSMAGALALCVAALAVIGWLAPSAVPLCFTPDDKAVVCPVRSESAKLESDPNPKDNDPTVEHDETLVTQEIDDTVSPGDIALVQLFGLIAAAVAGAASLRRLEGTSTPFNLPLVAAILKLPTGALTAVLGLVLMRGDFVPGLSALDNSAQILAWATIFGYSQELFTRFVDTRTQDVLGRVGTPGDQKQPDGTTVPSVTAT